MQAFIYNALRPILDFLYYNFLQHGDDFYVRMRKMVLTVASVVVSVQIIISLYNLCLLDNESHPRENLTQRISPTNHTHESHLGAHGAVHEFGDHRMLGLCKEDTHGPHGPHGLLAVECQPRRHIDVHHVG